LAPCVERNKRYQSYKYSIVFLNQLVVFQAYAFASQVAVDTGRQQEDSGIPLNDVNGLMDLLKSVREEILKFPGYVTSEYLENVEDPTNLLVISTWKNPEHWKAWVNSKVCKQLTDQVEQKLIEPLKINVYNYHLFKSKRVWSI